MTETGIITGAKGLVPFSSWIFQGPNDGKVSVARSRHPAMTDFRVMDVNHTFIMNNRDVRAQIVHFLQHGRFTGTAE